MDSLNALAVVAVAQQVLVMLMWAGAARVGLSRPAAVHWAAAAAVQTVTLLLLHWRDELPPFAAFVLLNALGVSAMSLVRRGVQRFCDVPTTDRDAVVVIVGVVVANSTVLALGLALSWVVFFTSLALAWVLLGTARVMVRRLPFEFGRHIGVALALPTGLTGLVFLVRGALAPALTAVGTPMTAIDHPALLVFAVYSIIMLLLSQFSLGAMTVLRVVRQLRHLSTHDALTGVLNRRGLDDRLDRELERLHRYGQPFALLSLDIDHFKAINDRHGHAVGDAVLMRVAQSLGGGVREVDVLGRSGGEEFMVLMPHTDAEAAAGAAQRLLQRLHDHPAGPQGAVVTASIGVASASNRRERRDDLLRRLDGALYAAKQGGRDRVVLAPEADAAMRLAAD
ncbi:MAG: GGDEF domain-containing protein [Rubrivivax sp.]|jgi:diguanylate cyclase (GGDEF)-like protein